MRSTIVTKLGLMALCVFYLNGCGKGQPGSPAAGEMAADDHEHGDEHAHEHEEGPHGGHIIELGVEDYHAELTHDDATNRVGVYLLGGDAKTVKPIAAESVVINVRVENEPNQYVLPAVAQAGDEQGKASYFEIVSEPLTVVVAGKSEKDATARLGVTIDDKPFTGLIETEAHDHDHAH